jgi:hypothetical protein
MGTKLQELSCFLPSKAGHIVIHARDWLFLHGELHIGRWLSWGTTGFLHVGNRACYRRDMCHHFGFVYDGAMGGPRVVSGYARTTVTEGESFSEPGADEESAE